MDKIVVSDFIRGDFYILNFTKEVMLWKNLSLYKRQKAMNISTVVAKIFKSEKSLSPFKSVNIYLILLQKILPAHNGIPVRRNGLTEFGVQPMMIAIFMIVLMWWLLKETIV